MPEFKALLDSPSVYRTQIYFSKITRDKNGKVKFTDYHFKKHDLYYYPASCVKLPVIINALVKFNGRKLSLQNKLFIQDSTYCGFAGQTEIQNGWYFKDYIKRMLVVSNNICFNPIFDFISKHNCKSPFSNTPTIYQRFNFHCNDSSLYKSYPFVVKDDSGKIIYSEPMKEYDYQNFLDTSWAKAGLRYLNNKDSLINHPKSFSKSNFYDLIRLHEIIKNITADEFVFIENENRNFLLKYMSIYPSECRHPAYDSKEYPDNWGKYLLIGDDTNFHKSIPIQQLPTLSIGEGKGEVIKEKLLNWNDDSIRIFNKVGMAYGFLTDCAYIVDYKNQVEFIVSASVFVDRDGTLNDGKYAYKEIGLPFLGKLGRVLMQHELKHKRKSKFAAQRIEYTD
jgi:hypothetical protein